MLVVDDDKLTRWSAATILGSMGYQVSEAASLMEATALLDKRTPRLVLLDIRLPDGDGFTLLQHIRKQHPVIPVVMMTAHPSSETVERALNLGAAGHLKKPFRSDELKQAVLDVLQGRRMQDE